MKIQIGHSGEFNYEEALYEPLRESDLITTHEIILPHDTYEAGIDSYESLGSTDLFIAEVSLPSTGLGMELAWAREHGVPILALYQKDSSPSGSLMHIEMKLVSYNDTDDMIQQIESYIDSIHL